jgi:hypothetical protein
MGIPARLRRGGRATFAVLTGLVAALTLFSAAPATAAGAPAARPATVHPTTMPFSFTLVVPRAHRHSAAGPQDTPDVINCSGGIAGPGFAGVNVRVAGVATCSSPVVDLEITVTLFRNGDQPWGQGSSSTTQFAAAVGDGPCIPGSGFSGKMHVFVDFGPEFEPPEATADVFTPFVNFPDC